MNLVLLSYFTCQSWQPTHINSIITNTWGSSLMFWFRSLLTLILLNFTTSYLYEEFRWVYTVSVLRPLLLVFVRFCFFVKNTVFTRFTARSWLRARLNSRPCEQNKQINKGPCFNTRPVQKLIFQWQRTIENKKLLRNACVTTLLNFKR